MADRVEEETGDITRPPFADASFDVVVSMTVAHNIPSRDSLKQAATSNLSECLSQAAASPSSISCMCPATEVLQDRHAGVIFRLFLSLSLQISDHEACALYNERFHCVVRKSLGVMEDRVVCQRLNRGYANK